MADISKIDKNFAVPTKINTAGLDLYSVTDAPFRIYGLLPPTNSDDVFLRLPAQIAATVNEGVSALNCNTAGGRVRFRTDSPFVTIRAALHAVGHMHHMTISGSAGFDLYYRDRGEERFGGTFLPPHGFMGTNTYECRLDLKALTGEEGFSMRDITINFPLYSGVRSVQIGLKEGAQLEAPTEYQYTDPIVYYGSSITQGGCASRPGNAYQSIISRELDCDFVNLGFSGSARGEDTMADYIAGLPMSVLVYDYDHNAPTVEHLQNTHERMFLRIRERRPDLPVIMVSRPQTPLLPEGKARRTIIETTYQSALARGDKNVWFIDGESFFAIYGGNSETVDGCHPNDIGFMCMAEKIGCVVKQALRTL